MSFFHAIILGIVEGLTEFVPVSSSGHLLITHALFGATPNDLAIDAVLQLGTIIAVAFYFRVELWRLFLAFIDLVSGKHVEPKERTLLLAIIVGTVPAVILGLLPQTILATTFRSPHLVAYALLAGSALMFFADRSRGIGKKTVTVTSGLILGFFQSLALIPGISRSGATISGGLYLGFSREEATRFSFLLSFPVIAGAGLKELLSLRHVAGVLSAPLLVGSIVAFAVGLWSISFLLKYLRTHNLNIFVIYRILIAIAILVWL